MICKNCLNNIPDGAKFCPVCGGAEISEPAAQETSAMESVGAAPKAAEDKADVVPFCYICSLELESGAKFCPVCGSQAGYKEKSDAFAAIYGTDNTAPSAQAVGAIDAQPFGAFAGLDNSAAVTVKPIKKKSRAPLVAGISAGAAVLVLGGVFAFNSAAILPAFMGKANYAAMIESKTAADIVGQAADSALVNALAENAAKSAARYASYSYVGSMYSGVDIKGIIAQINNELCEYGGNSQIVEISPSIQLTNAGTEILFGGEAAYKEAVYALNQSDFTVALTADENAAALGIALDENGAVTDANVILCDDNTVYIDLPFADKAFKYTLSEYISDSENGAGSYELKLDPKETARIIKEISDIYTTHYKSAEFTIEKGELSAAGVIAEGQLVSCTMNSECLGGLFEDIFAFLAEDEYLCAAITDYINANGGEISAQEYADIIKGFAENIIDEDCALKIKTVVNSSCKVIAKTVVCVDGESESSFSYVNGKSKAALEINNGGNIFTANLTRQNKNDGTLNIKSTGDRSFSAKAVYNGVEFVKYGGKNTFTGTVRLSCVPPADFTESGSFAAVYSAISKAELSITQSVSGKKLSQHIELSVPQYGKAAVDAVVSSGENEITIPTNAIDLNSLFSGDDNLKEFGNVLSAIAASADKNAYFAGKIADAAQSAAQEIENTFKPQAVYEDVIALQNNIQFCIETAESLYENYSDEMTDEYIAQCDDIIKRFKALKKTIESEYSDYNMTLERYNELDAQEYEIDEELAELIAKLNKAQNAKLPISQRGDINYSNLDAFDLFDAFHACESDYLSIILVYYGEIEENEELLSLYEKATDAYQEAYDEILTLNNQMTEGNWSAQLVRNARRAAEKFDKALTALESQLGGTAL